MAEFLRKSLERPDEIVDVPGVRVHMVDLGDFTVGRMVNEPGWRWSTHMRPQVGADLCQVRHVGVVVSGRLGIEVSDGGRFELGPGDVFDIPPGHDGYTVGDEACVTVEWIGLRAFAGARAGTRGRALRTLLFTDVVDSTAIASRLGDRAWRHLLSAHFEAARAQLDNHGETALVSEATLTLASGLAFEDRGTSTLKGLDGEWRLFAHVPDEQGA